MFTAEPGPGFCQGGVIIGVPVEEGADVNRITHTPGTPVVHARKALRKIPGRVVIHPPHQNNYRQARQHIGCYLRNLVLINFHASSSLDFKYHQDFSVAEKHFPVADKRVCPVGAAAVGNAE